MFARSKLMSVFMAVCVLGALHKLSSQTLADCNACAAGSISCTGTISANDPSSTNRILTDVVDDTCATPGAFPGTSGAVGPFHYTLYRMKNTLGATQCFTLVFTNTACGHTLNAASYSPSFDPTNVATNWKGGPGTTTANGTSDTWSISLANNATADIVIWDTVAVPSTCAGNYTLTITPCPGTTPTVIKLDWFSAAAYDAGSMLEWKTGMEVGNLGFNIYREDGIRRTRLNSQVLAGSALLCGPTINLRSGGSYSWFDNQPAGKDTRYWIEDIDLNGQSEWHGPIFVDRSKPREGLRPPGGRNALLSAVGIQGAQQGSTSPLTRTAGAPGMTAAQFAVQSDLAMRPAMKLSVRQEGWYRVGQSELAAAGFDTRTDPRMLQMFVDGQEQAISVSGQEDGRFDSTDVVEFYGLGTNSPYTDSRTYWLASGSQPGMRIGNVKGKGSRAAPASFPYTVERRDHNVYFGALRNGDAENFFGAVVAREAVDQSINVQHLDPAGSGGELEIALQGVTEIAHRVRVELNGSEIGAMGFDGQSAGVTKLPLGRNALKEGQNVVRLTSFGGESDVCVVQYLRITYPHTYAADGDALRFNVSAKQQVSIDGFTSSAIRVIDVTDPDAVREVTSRVEGRKGSYSVNLSAPKGGGERVLLAFADSQANGPAAMTLNRPSNLREPAIGADLVIISHRAFLDSVAPLKAAREAQGFKVAAVDVEDLYDEFNFGQRSPQAVKDFLAFARSSWQTPPRYALLVGDASVDPKGYLGFGDSDLVPTKLIDTALMETASDGWFGDFNGGSGEIAIGRLPVRTPEEAVAMIAKIVGYDRSESVDRVMLVADSSEDFDFQSLNANLKNMIPPNVLVREIDRGRDGAAAEGELIAGLDQGQKIVNYVGHGNVDQWRGSLLTSASASGLTNSKHLPLFVMMTCLNGYFQDPLLEGLAESLMKAERGGAVAVWASSGMTEPTEQSVLNQQMFKLVLDSANASSLTLGEATLKAKSAVSDVDIRRTWILFGDPTMRLR